jgi:hypothetical protein
MVRGVTWEPSGDDERMVDLRPVVWDATMVTPDEEDGVTVIVRVTYRTLEAIVLDLTAVTESRATRPN